MIEVRNGIQVPVESLTRYQHRTPVDDFLDEQGALRRDLERVKLRSNLSRILPYVYSQERADLQAAVAVLDAGGFNARAVSRMLASTAAKIVQLPTQSRSMAFPVETRAGSDRTITFIASTDGVDRHSSRILPMGIETDLYLQNAVVGFGHDLYGGFLSAPDPRNVIGKTLRLRKSERALEADIQFLSKAVNERAEMVYQQVLAKALNCCSVGFIPLEIRSEMHDGREIPVIARCTLLEISIVPIPSNPAALAMGRA